MNRKKLLVSGFIWWSRIKNYLWYSEPLFADVVEDIVSMGDIPLRENRYSTLSRVRIHHEISPGHWIITSTTSDRRTTVPVNLAGQYDAREEWVLYLSWPVCIFWRYYPRFKRNAILPLNQKNSHIFSFCSMFVPTGTWWQKPKYLTIVNPHLVMVIHYEGSFLL